MEVGELSYSTNFTNLGTYPMKKKTKSVSFESQLWQQQFTADDSPTMDRSDPPAAGGGLRSRLMTVPCGIEVGKAVSGK